jgi:hypothetical protein
MVDRNLVRYNLNGPISLSFSKLMNLTSMYALLSTYCTFLLWNSFKISLKVFNSTSSSEIFSNLHSYCIYSSYFSCCNNCRYYFQIFIYYNLTWTIISLWLILDLDFFHVMCSVLDNNQLNGLLSTFSKFPNLIIVYIIP